MEAFWGILIIRGGGRVADKEKKTTPRFELNPDSRNPRHQSRVLSSPRVIPLYPVISRRSCVINSALLQPPRYNKTKTSRELLSGHGPAVSLITDE